MHLNSKGCFFILTSRVQERNFINILGKEISQFLPRTFVSYKSAYTIAQVASNAINSFLQNTFAL